MRRFDSKNSAEVVLLEPQEVASSTRGRNGGFVVASLAHSFSNGLQRRHKKDPILFTLR